MLKRKLISLTNTILLFVSFLLVIFYFSISVGNSNFNEEYSKEKQFENGLETSLKELINCTNKNYDQELYQSGSFWILKNFVRAEHGSINCYESVTYTTQSDVKYIDHLIPIVKRWAAPISIALFAPNVSNYFSSTIDSIKYMRNCVPEKDLLRKYVTFHLYFELSDRPVKMPIIDENNEWESDVDCEKSAPYLIFRLKNYSHNRQYFINVGRNVANKAALTYYRMSSDIELYPSKGLVHDFFKYIEANPYLVQDRKRRVFIIPTFEVDKSTEVPLDTTQLYDLLINKKAIYFFQSLCAHCFPIPNKPDYTNKMGTNPDFSTFTIIKRLGKYKAMEHFYIGSENDPIYAEEITWNIKGNKMVHEYVMCLLEYDYHFMQGAFLSHAPGFHTTTQIPVKLRQIAKSIFVNKLKPLFDAHYGYKKGCSMTLTY